MKALLGESYIDKKEIKDEVRNRVFYDNPALQPAD